ncbi:MAG: hypothetical protein AAGC60_04430 [Acidobacteriota bacterium]
MIASKWPETEPDPTDIAARVRYVGSPEHKAYPSAAGPPRPRPDATLCDPKYKGREEELSGYLKEAIRREVVSSQFESGFPRYVWLWLEGVLYEARHINGPHGTYKAYALVDEAEYPKDPRRLLEGAEG